MPYSQFYSFSSIISLNSIIKDYTLDKLKLVLLTTKKLKILFRVSGGPIPEKEIGFGHVYRSMNLASKLKNNKIFFLIEDYGKVKEILHENDYKNTYSIKNKGDVNSDIRQTSEIISKKNIDILIIDMYKINTDYLSHVRKFTKVVIITDLDHKDYHADLIVNGFIGFKNKTIKNKYGDKCLVGPLYQILNKEFSKNYQMKKKYKLLITFGGFVNIKIVETILKLLIKHSRIKTKIILGPGTKKSREFSLLKNRIKGNIVIIQKTKNMYKEILQSEIGICSGGITTYEFASMKIPFAIICQADHQLITAREWQKSGIGLNLGLFNSRTKYKIEEFLLQVLENKMSFHLDKNFKMDGHGAERVVKEILRLKSHTNT